MIGLHVQYADGQVDHFTVALDFMDDLFPWEFTFPETEYPE